MRVLFKGVSTFATAATLRLSRIANQKEYLRSFLRAVTTQNADLQHRNKRLHEVAAQRDELRRHMADVVAIKARQEEEYLRKFVAVLNEKKAHIRELSATKASAPPSAPSLPTVPQPASRETPAVSKQLPSSQSQPSPRGGVASQHEAEALHELEEEENENEEEEVAEADGEVALYSSGDDRPEPISIASGPLRETLDSSLNEVAVGSAPPHLALAPKTPPAAPRKSRSPARTIQVSPADDEEPNFSELLQKPKKKKNPKGQPPLKRRRSGSVPSLGTVQPTVSHAHSRGVSCTQDMLDDILLEQ
eukprot:TRINITY_DN12715_c0_g1_i2.p1 TRINITY_DN12715_c0_g1~~TRINITY_DN12715_c0_g1_i2.p1  ORF type:complete len:305 (+),score=56.14 TRINITY_DN12715_c0_g1_i2:339-1253(+)